MNRRFLQVLGIGCFGVAAAALLMACGCTQSDSTTQPDAAANKRPVAGEIPSADSPDPAAAEPSPAAPSSSDSEGSSSPQVVIKTSMGEITVKLDAEKAPITVNNFLDNYVDRGFYSDTIFHYVDPGKTVMGGGYTEDLTPKPTRAPISNEADNGLKNRRGTIAMARSTDFAHSATSQFFFNLVDNPSFDYVGRDTAEDFGYCVFGQVISGMDVLDRMGRTEVHDVPGFTNLPKPPIVIQSIKQVQ